MFSFAAPYYVLLVMAPLLVMAWRERSKPKRVEHDKGKPVLFHPAAVLLGRLQQQYGGAGKMQAFSRLRFLCWWLGWISLVVAAMGPQWVEEEVKVQGEGVDMVLAVDLSRSMLAQDFATDVRRPDGRITRLQVVKQVVERFMQGRLQETAGDRYGLVLFGEHAYVQSALTLDGMAMVELLKQAEATMAGNATAIGDAMALSVRMLRTRPRGGRVLILLTDGDNTAGSIPPKEAARIVKEFGVRFYAIAVGKSDEANIMVRTPYGYDIEKERLPFDEEALKELVKIADGQYFRADSADTLQKIYDRIDKLERSEAEEQVRVIAVPLYRWPLGAGGVFLLLYALCPLWQARRIKAIQAAAQGA